MKFDEKATIFFSGYNIEKLDADLTFISNCRSWTYIRVSRYKKCYGDFLIHGLHLFPGTSQKRAITVTSSQS